MTDPLAIADAVVAAFLATLLWVVFAVWLWVEGEWGETTP